MQNEWNGGSWLTAGPVLLLAQEDVPATNTQGAGAGEETQSQIGAAPAGGNPPPTTTAKPPSTWPFLVMMVVVFGFLIWQSSSSQRKEKKKREEMLGALKRHDRVQTIGGLIGSIVEIKENEVVLKVDEASNVKVRFSKSAVQQVLTEAESTGEAAGKT